MLRGMDLSATAPETLRPICQHYNSWLLDWNRDRMDRMFSNAA